MPFEFNIDYGLVVAGLAAIAAWVAAAFSYRSYEISRKALLLAESEFNSKKSNIDAYVADSFRVYDTKRKQGKYIFSIAYSNKSEIIDSITVVILETYYVNDSNRVAHIVSVHEEDSDAWVKGNASPAKLPINIEPRSSVTRWFVFGLPSVAEKAQRIEKYRVVARNGNGEEAAVESYILREIEYEKDS